MENRSLNGHIALARQEDLVVQELPDEVMVYDLKRHKAHCLNHTAAFIWQHCDGQTSTAELASLLQQEAGAPVDEEVVWYTLDKLKKAELLEGNLAVPVKDSMSRRKMIRRLGAMLVIPTVVSLVAPTAMAQTSVIVLSKKIACGQCNQQDNPESCTDTTCCTGACGGPNRTCVSTGSPSSTPGQVDTSCTGQLCQASSDAAPCS
jgi:hypothetical protein